MTAPSVQKPKLMIALHWLSALLVVGMFSSAWWRNAIDEALPLSAQLLVLHKQIGILVLALLAWRFVVRLFHKQSAQSLPKLLVWTAHFGHAMLYLTLLAMPLLGWAMSNAMGHPVTLLGFMPLPDWVGIDPDLADTLQEWHETGAWILIALIVMHLAAALWHHFFRKDETLVSMAPWLRQSK